MKSILRDPPNWDAHLDEAIEEVNALYPAAMDIVAVKTDPREEAIKRALAGPPAWVFGVAGSMFAALVIELACWFWHLMGVVALR